MFFVGAITRVAGAAGDSSDCGEIGEMGAARVRGLHGQIAAPAMGLGRLPIIVGGGVAGGLASALVGCGTEQRRL